MTAKLVEPFSPESTENLTGNFLWVYGEPGTERVGFPIPKKGRPASVEVEPGDQFAMAKPDSNGGVLATKCPVPVYGLPRLKNLSLPEIRSTCTAVIVPEDVAEFIHGKLLACGTDCHSPPGMSGYTTLVEVYSPIYLNKFVGTAKGLTYYCRVYMYSGKK